MLERLAALGWYLAALVIVGSALPVVFLVWAATALVDRDRRIAGRLLRYFGNLLVRAYPMWRVTVEGQLPPGAFVLAPNHRSWLDVLVLCRLPRELKWVAKAELFRIPWVGWLFHLSGDIPVRRGQARSGADALARAREYLEHGVPVVFFPEGTRSRDGKLRTFKPGAFDVAAEVGVPVVPVAITGTADGMPPGSPWIRPARVVVRILEPVRGDAVATAAETRARIAAALV